MRVSKLLKTLITILLFVAVFNAIELKDIRLNPQDLSLIPALAALVSLIISLIILRALRWNSILSVLDRPLSFWDVCSLTAVSQFFNQVLPSTVGGDGVRILMLRKANRPFKIAVHSVLLDRLFGITALLLICVLSLSLFLAHFTQDRIVVTLVVAGTVVLLCGLMLPVATRIAHHVLPTALASKLNNFGRSATQIWQQRRSFLALITLSIIGHALLSLSAWLIAAALGLSLPFIASMLLLPAVFLISTIPISLGGWGAREGGMILILGVLGVAPEQALLISVGYGLSELAICSMGGITWLARRNTGSNLRPTLPAVGN